MSSDELEWELYDVFEAAIFPFPIYDHQTARKIIRYLLYRGVLDEEIADAIEDSTADLHIWLNRSGKNMVGEWVIAWLNEGREDYKKEKKREARERGYSWHDHEAGSEESSHSSDDGSSSDGDDACMATSISNHFANRDTMRKWAARMHAIDDSNTESSYEDEELEAETEVKKCPSLSPPPSPPPVPRVEGHRELATTATIPLSARIPLEMLHMHCSIDSQTASSEISPRSHIQLSFSDEHFQQTPDSGAISDMYSSHPAERMDTSEDNREEGYYYNQGPAVTKQEEINPSVPGHSVVCTAESHLNMARSGIPSCPSCSCAVVHYSLIPKPTTVVATATTTTAPTSSARTAVKRSTAKLASATNGQMQTKEQKKTVSVFLADVPVLSAMDFHMETLDREGPGYVFIMTDVAQNFLSWSTEHRYKVASSRQPERWLAEFHNRGDTAMELVWQVKVRSHLRALREVHLKLLSCKLHSDWFKCSLSTVMDTISRVVRKYKI